MVYKRRKSIEVKIGNTPVGGINPIRVQTMLNTDTNDIEASVKQSIRCIKAGAEYIRITAQGEKEALNLALIKEGLRKKGYNIPIIADIHFNPKVAEIAATVVEKIRINPGNYSDKKKLKDEKISNEKYHTELQRIEKKIIPLLETCKKHGTAIRIGTNYGSLSDRIMNKYGDTPEGMVESAMEFLRICKQNSFQDIVLSMKASNTRVMVYANRLLVKKMMDEDMLFPVHLGVTEAGDGEDGRIKSAVGIGTLLADGIGDTIRVSLTEDPEFEIPVAKSIIDHYKEIENNQPVDNIFKIPFNQFAYERRKTAKVHNIGNNQVPVVIINLWNVADINEIIIKKLGFKKIGEKWIKGSQTPDYIYCGKNIPRVKEVPVGYILDYEIYEKVKEQIKCCPLFQIDDLQKVTECKKTTFILSTYNNLTREKIEILKQKNNIVLVLRSDNKNSFADTRAVVLKLINQNCRIPVIFEKEYLHEQPEKFQIDAACDFGGLFIDGLGNGIYLSAPGISYSIIIKTSFQILQSTGERITKTEYISCPSCGRTNFNLQKTVAEIKSLTSHLKGLKIGIMGCIVNGPGEMADAHYGYVGAGKDKITLYKGKNIIKKNIPSNEAINELIKIIKENGDWMNI